jgi:16S rRNA (guanine527-N7)-methyltransferase
VIENVITRYFSSLSEVQKDQISKLKPVYEEWNSRINVISRKDMDNFMVHHVLHSLSIAKFISFSPATRILDIGTGGGFPGIPLAILFPDSELFLLDSIGKKIKVVTEVARELGLVNVVPVWKRAEDEDRKYDFVVSRAVTQFYQFVKLSKKNISGVSRNSLANGIIYLKGGNLDEEIEPFLGRVEVREISDFFGEPFFETKKIVYLPV